METNDIYGPPVKFQNVYGAGSPSNGFEGGFLADGALQQTAMSFGPKMDGSLVDQYLPHGEKTPFVPHPNNWKELYQAGLNSTTTFAINGGGEKSSFRVSYAYTDNDGVFKRNKFTRHSVSFKGITDLNKVFSIETGVNYSFSKAQNAANQGGWNWGGNAAMMSTYYTPRNLDLKEYIRLYRDPVTHAVKQLRRKGTLREYLHDRDMNLYQRAENSFLTNITLRANILPKLTASVRQITIIMAFPTTKTYGTGANYGPSGTGSYGRGSQSGSYNFLEIPNEWQRISIADETITLDAIVAAEFMEYRVSFLEQIRPMAGWWLLLFAFSLIQKIN